MLDAKTFLQYVEHGRAVHCNATASGTLRGGQTDRGGEGVYEVVGSKRIDRETAKSRVAETDSEPETDTEEEEARITSSGVTGLSGAEWSGASVDNWDVKTT